MSAERNSSKLMKLQQAVNKCPRCGKATLTVDSDSGELVCSNCGLVVKERTEETGPEWRSANIEEGQDRRRTGMPTSIVEHDMGLSTVVGRSNRDAAGGMLTGQMRSTVERLRTWDRRTQLSAPGDRNLNRAFSELRRYSEKVAVSQEVVERAAYIYRKAVERGLIRGRSITLMTGAALYAAIRDLEIPRTLKDIAAASNVSKKDLARSYRLLVKELDLKMPIADASRSVSKIASKAGLSERTKRRAQEILARARQSEISAGKDPMGLAASALYVASVLEGENKTQKEIAAAAAVTEVTIRNRYKGLTTALGIRV